MPQSKSKSKSTRIKSAPRSKKTGGGTKGLPNLPADVRREIYSHFDRDQLWKLRDLARNDPAARNRLKQLLRGGRKGRKHGLVPGPIDERPGGLLFDTRRQFTHRWGRMTMPPTSSPNEKVFARRVNRARQAGVEPWIQNPPGHPWQQPGRIARNARTGRYYESRHAPRAAMPDEYWWFPTNLPKGVRRAKSMRRTLRNFEG